MSESATARRPTGATAIGTLALLYTATFLLGAVLHLGVTVPIGGGVLTQPVIPPATVVETLCGLALAFAGWAVLADRPWAWRAAVSGHVVALAGVSLGIARVAAGAGPANPLNDVYHRVMVGLLIAGLVWLLTPAGRAALRRNHR